MNDLDEALRHLRRDVPPVRDLWPQIAAQIAGRQTPSRARWHRTVGRAALAASLVALIGAGLWFSRGPLAPASGDGPHMALHIASLTALGPEYLSDRERLLNAFPRELSALPSESQATVAASLADIHKALRDIDAALAQNPGSALLQELLINTCQDEMRVLIAVQEAGAAGRTV